MDFIIHLQIILLAPVLFFLLYLGGLTLLSLAARLKTEFDEETILRFAVVIPAHNEERTIAKTLRSALALDYPKERFTVIVIADNCTDETADAARDAGATVYERAHKTLRGKGYALRWMFDRLAKSDAYDAVVVVDADSALSVNYLRVMNHYLGRGALSLQSTDIVEPGALSWSASMIRISFLLFNYVRPLGRSVVGLPVSLRGNGMCFAVDTLRSVPWEAYSLAEDVDYGLQLMLNNIPTFFVPEAAVFATMPENPDNARSQRERWEGGRASLVRKFSLPLLKSALHSISFAHLDTLVDLVTPSIVNLAVVSGGMLVMNFGAILAGNPTAPIYAGIWLSACVLLGFHLIAGLYAAGADGRLYRTLFQIPRYILWKMGLYLHIFRKGTEREWVRTTRESPPVQENDPSR